MVAIGLFALRLVIARPLVRRVPGTSLRAALDRVRRSPSVVGLIAIPVYLDFSIANDSLRSVFDLGALVPLFRVTAFGRGYVDMELCFALFCVAALDRAVGRPARRDAALDRRARRRDRRRARGRGGAVRSPAPPATPGRPRRAGSRCPFDWLHLLSGSVWLGGLVGLLVLWFTRRPSAAACRCLSVVVPRFSNVALASVLVLLATGTGATIIHMPTVDALWETGYGDGDPRQDRPARRAVALASVNLLRTKPRLVAARDATRSSARRQPACSGG